RPRTPGCGPSTHPRRRRKPKWYENPSARKGRTGSIPVSGTTPALHDTGRHDFFHRRRARHAACCTRRIGRHTTQSRPLLPRKDAIMSIISRQVGSAPDGISLQTRVDDMEIQCYVVVGEPDLELVTGIVPPEDFESGADVHAAAVTSAAQAGEQVE